MNTIQPPTASELAMYRAEKARREERAESVMAEAKAALAAVAADASERRKMGHGRCKDCGADYEFVRGNGRPPLRCLPCRTAGPTSGVTREAAVPPRQETSEPEQPAAAPAEAEPSSKDSAVRPFGSAPEGTLRFAIGELLARALEHQREVLMIRQELNDAAIASLEALDVLEESEDS